MTCAMPGRLQGDAGCVRTVRDSACEGLRVIEAASGAYGLADPIRQIREGTERVCRPDSVHPEGRDGHSSWPAVACRLQPSTRTLGWAPCAAGAASRAYMMLLRMGFGLPRLSPAARWALTPPFHPCPPGRSPPGGLFSVPLSVALGRKWDGVPLSALWRLAVSQHPAQWSPDLPPGCPGDRPTRSGHDCTTPFAPRTCSLCQSPSRSAVQGAPLCFQGRPHGGEQAPDTRQAASAHCGRPRSANHSSPARRHSASKNRSCRRAEARLNRPCMLAPCHAVFSFSGLQTLLRIFR